MAQVQDIQFTNPKIPVSPFDTDSQTKQLDIQNRLKLAAALQEAGKQPDHTEVVTGVAVPQSPLSGLARALTQTIGGYQQGQADRDAKDLQGQQYANMITAAGSGSSLTPEQAKTLIQIDPTGKALGEAYAANIKGQQEQQTKQIPAGGGMTFGDSPTPVQPPIAPPTMPPQLPPQGQSNIQMTPQIMAESGGNPNAVSPKGAQGLMQIMPTTAANPGFGVQPAQNNSPQENVRVGQQYMSALSGKYGGDQSKALAAYNWGPGNVDKMIANSGWDQSKLPAETQAYIAKLAGQPMPTTQEAQSLPPIGQPQSFADQAVPQQPTQGLPPIPASQIGYQNGKPVPVTGPVLAKDANGQMVQKTLPNMEAKQKLEYQLQYLSDQFDKLKDQGGAVSTDQGLVQNAANTVAGSSFKLPEWSGGAEFGGQDAARMAATAPSVTRDNIKAAIKQTTPLYMQAMGITPGMERAVGAQQMLQDALGGSTTKSYQHNKEQLARISQEAGLGTIKSEPSVPKGNKVIKYDAQGNRI